MRFCLKCGEGYGGASATSTGVDSHVCRMCWTPEWQGLDVQREMNRFAEVGPALLRALLLVEWDKVSSSPESPECPLCGRAQADARYGHQAACILDVALTAAGFPDQVSRDAARRAGYVTVLASPDRNPGSGRA